MIKLDLNRAADRSKFGRAIHAKLSRFTPVEIESQLLKLLSDLQRSRERELAAEGETQVIADIRGASNLRTTMEKILARAGHHQWPKLFQNFRASRETQLLGQFPAKDVTSWLGNGVAVAMKHYAMARESTFEAATKTPSGSMPEFSQPKGEAKPEADSGGPGLPGNDRLQKKPGKTGLNSAWDHS